MSTSVAGGSTADSLPPTLCARSARSPPPALCASGAVSASAGSASFRLFLVRFSLLLGALPFWEAGAGSTNSLGSSFGLRKRFLAAARPYLFDRAVSASLRGSLSCSGSRAGLLAPPPRPPPFLSGGLVSPPFLIGGLVSPPFLFGGLVLPMASLAVLLPGARGRNGCALPLFSNIYTYSAHAIEYSRYNTEYNAYTAHTKCYLCDLKSAFFPQRLPGLTLFSIIVQQVLQRPVQH